MPQDEERVTKMQTYGPCFDNFGAIVACDKPATRNERDVKLPYSGVDPDAPVVVAENGAKQSLVEGMFNEIPPLAMFELAKVMEHGAKKYGEKNWHGIPTESHVNHLLMHVFAWLAGDRQEKHLTHALARAAMAVERDEMDQLEANRE